MANTYQLIAKSELTTTTATVEFTSIPQTYSDLMLRIVARTNTVDGNVNIYLRVNNDTSTNYSSIQQSWYTSGVNYNINSNRAQLDNGPWAAGANLDTNIFGTNTVYIPNYTNTTQRTISVLGGITRMNNSTSWVIDEAALYRGSSAITSIQLPPYSGSYVAGSNFYLYGIAKS